MGEETDERSGQGFLAFSVETLSAHLRHFGVRGIPVAFRVLADARCDRKRGIYTTGDRKARETLVRAKESSSARYEAPHIPTTYREIRRMVRYLELTPDDVFLDIGCGKGRVVLEVARQKLARVIGVEKHTHLWAVAHANAMLVDDLQSPVDILLGDALETLRDDRITVYYLFDPFGRDFLEQAVGSIRESLTRSPRYVRVVYKHPAWKEVLDGASPLRRARPITSEIFVWESPR
jgi:SAM-dependent methyltransferase